jgi:hypothetical protein
MKERPIIFKAPMVRAILDGRKTQARLLAPIANLNIKTHSDGLVTWGVEFTKNINGVLGSHSGGRYSVDQASRIIASQFCQYGRPGDRLWVKETWARDDDDGAVMFRADCGLGGDADDWQRCIDDGAPRYRWRPSIHMPRRLSRIDLEVVSARVERLNDISERDAWAESCEGFDDDVTGGKSGYSEFAELWESINGAGSWYANPWVWVIEFRRLESS